MRIPAPSVDERMESGRPQSSQTTVSVNFDDADSLSSHPRIKFGVAECIETKTITTTTTTKRSYPPLLVRESQPLSSLDSKEYPLAQKPTPPELAKFTFNIAHYGGASWPVDNDTDRRQDVCHLFPILPIISLLLTNSGLFPVTTIYQQRTRPRCQDRTVFRRLSFPD